MGRRAVHAALAAAALAAIPAVASAHLSATGMGPLYDGVAHFSLSPEDILPAVAAGLFAGLRGPRPARWSAAALGAVWLAGGVVGLAGAAPSAVALSVATAGVFLLVGGLLAANAELPLAAGAGACGAVGLVRGLADAQGVSASLPHFGALCAMAAAAGVTFVLAASVTLPLKRFWMVVAVRVGGSWLAAAGLLLAGWVWRYGARAG